jgi:hypothetical protein
MRFFYKPFGIVAGILSGLLARKIFEFVWARFDTAEPPGPETRSAPLTKVIGAAALEGLTFRATRAAVDRAGARSFEHFTGVWPGEKEPDPAGLG